MRNHQAGPPGRLIQHFNTRTRREQQSQGWSELWDSDQSDLWDRGKPSPALIDFVESRPAVIRPRKDGRRPRALVPLHILTTLTHGKGCGRGYDVAMLALHGFDAYGLEVSEKGAEVAREYAASQLAQPGPANFGSEKQWPVDQAGNARIIAGDFFKRDWEHDCAEGGEAGFDLIYDYTFLCALLPEMREDWARRMSELLGPGGVLVCLEFPLYKDLGDVGPPWGLNGVYWNILAQGGSGLIREPGEETEASGGKFTRALHFKPPRSYENGRGTDMVSVWRLK